MPATKKKVAKPVDKVSAPPKVSGSEGTPDEFADEILKEDAVILDVLKKAEDAEQSLGAIYTDDRGHKA